MLIYYNANSNEEDHKFISSLSYDQVLPPRNKVFTLHYRMYLITVFLYLHTDGKLYFQ